ncbi:hypothetical protein PR048_013984 [Dryococelus australis]|uniref:Uncharacterized protein n=1 Tax=Dryococelus australis TaxID=614101 RepID=A0ABQ9HUM3_9NEOP|nr:hypothetical protein PR048_013984 [Dryococelus australis]
MYYKRSVISLETRQHDRESREVFNISKYHYFEYSSEKKGVVKASEWLGGLVSHTFVLGKIPDVSLSPITAYPTRQVPIKKPKAEDLKKVCCYIPEECRDFYNRLTVWPTVTADDTYDEYRTLMDCLCG